MEHFSQVLRRDQFHNIARVVCPDWEDERALYFVGDLALKAFGGSEAAITVRESLNQIEG